MSGVERLLITGAGGFLGRAVVAAARGAGLPVTALVRTPGDGAAWAGDDGVSLVVLDLAAPGAAEALAPRLEGVTAVVHAAARMSGDDAGHARDTLPATEAVIAAVIAALSARVAPRPRLVLCSSFAVYGYAALPEGATLDEHTPAEPDPGRRDAYCRAKLAQEAMAIRAAQEAGLAVILARIGTLYGPGHLWTARLGYRIGGRVLCPGGRAAVPAIHVGDCARALVAAARTGRACWPGDLPMPSSGTGHVEIVNLVAPDPPTQEGWLAAAGQGRALRLPLKPLMRLARAGDLAAALVPPLGRLMPASLGEATLAARFKPLRYSTARAEDRLGLAARAFAPGSEAP